LILLGTLGGDEDERSVLVRCGVMKVSGYKVVVILSSSRCSLSAATVGMIRINSSNFEFMLRVLGKVGLMIK